MALTDFLASFTTDVARPNRFDVNIIVPALLQEYNPILRNLSLRCEATELPGRTFGTVDQKFGSNPTTKFPVHSSYNDLTMTFIVSGDMSERTFFDVWMEYINPTTTFDFDYKQNFAATISIFQYDLQDTLVYAVNLFNAYPIIVNQMDLDWSNDNMHKLTVVFAYDYWQNNGLENLGTVLPTISQSALGFDSYTDTLTSLQAYGAGSYSGSETIIPSDSPSSFLTSTDGVTYPSVSDEIAAGESQQSDDEESGT